MQRLNSILKGVDVLAGVPFDIPVQSVSADSRHIWPGGAFIAIQGLKQDGTLFIPEAVQKGAAVIISNGGRKRDHIFEQAKTPMIRVDNPRQALSRIAANFYGHPSSQMTVIGITGTNGKTTTSFLLKTILNERGFKSGLIGTLGVHAPGMEAQSPLTTPDSLDLHKTLRLLVEGGITHMVMEVSSHALELNRVDDVKFEIGVFTNLTQDHLDFHGTMDNYFNAKTKLFTMLRSDSKAVLNATDPRYEALVQITKAEIISYSLNGNADVTFKEWGMSNHGITGTIAAESETINVNSPLIGIHNLENILAAVATAVSMGIEHDIITRGIESCQEVPGRSELFRSNNGATIIIDYAHTPDAYHKLFSSLKMFLPEGGMLTVIFGCGGDRDHEKRPLMAEAAEQYADRIYVTPDNPRTESLDSINSDIDSGFKKENHVFYSNRTEAIHDAIAELGASDILAIVGKGRENFQIVGEERTPYSDVETVRNAIIATR